MFKNRIKGLHFLLVFCFLFIFGFRLYFSFQTTHFNTDEAYFHLRHITSLVDEQKLLSYDPLSYGGRYVLYPPFFHIFMALFSFGSLFLLKFLPELLISLNFFVIYLIAKEISGNSYGAVFSALLASFYPLLFSETLNNLSVYTLFLPVLLLLFYSLLKLEENFYLWIFVVLSFLLPFIHPSALLFVFTVLIYFVLLAGGALTPTKLKKEAVVFSLLFIIFIELLIYKKAFFEYGVSVVWYNVPSNIISDLFKTFSPLDLLINLGILPLILGSFGIYLNFFREKKKIAYMFAAFAIAILLLLFFRLLTFSLGLMFLGIVLSIFSASSFSFIYDYLGKLRINFLRKLFFVFLILIFIFSAFLPSYTSATKSNVVVSSKIPEFNWLEKNTDADDLVLGNLEEGNLIATLGKRKNVFDSSFLLAPDPVSRINDVDTIYTTVSEAVALQLLKKYDIKVIYVSYDTLARYNLTTLNYVTGSSCFISFREGKYYVVNC